MLPELDTVSFDAVLPLEWAPRDAASPALVTRETRLALRVLSAPVSETSDNADPAWQRMEAKLDLALELSLQVRHPQRPPMTACRLGLEGMAWQSAEPVAVHTPLQISFFPHAESALLISLPVTVRQCKALGPGRCMIVADLASAFDEDTRELWEKWIFRRHRRAIQER